MEAIDLSHPAWFTTFPCLVAPHPEEAFVSLLLRCDEANGWASGTTYTYVRGGSSRHVYLPDLVVPSKLSVETLAGRLCLPTSAIAATTYLSSLMRLFEIATPSPGRSLLQLPLSSLSSLHERAAYLALSLPAWNNSLLAASALTPFLLHLWGQTPTLCLKNIPIYLFCLHERLERTSSRSVPPRRSRKRATDPR